MNVSVFICVYLVWQDNFWYFSLLYSFSSLLQDNTKTDCTTITHGNHWGIAQYQQTCKTSPWETAYFVLKKSRKSGRHERSGWFSTTQQSKSWRKAGDGTARSPKAAGRNKPKRRWEKSRMFDFMAQTAGVMLACCRGGWDFYSNKSYCQ